MHKNYNSCLHILDMHIEVGRHQFSHRKQILVNSVFVIFMFEILTNPSLTTLLILNNWVQVVTVPVWAKHIMYP